MKPEIPRAVGQRLTLQKQAILDVLHAEERMLTAEEVYGKVREKYPNVSLGTVYRNLQGFSAQGAVRPCPVRPSARGPCVPLPCSSAGVSVR